MNNVTEKVIVQIETSFFATFYGQITIGLILMVIGFLLKILVTRFDLSNRICLLIDNFLQRAIDIYSSRTFKNKSKCADKPSLIDDYQQVNGQLKDTPSVFRKIIIFLGALIPRPPQSDIPDLDTDSADDTDNKE